MKSSKLQLTNGRQTIKKSEKKAIKGHLVNLFNRILDTGKYPALWSFGLIVPIHKKDDWSKVENYRGITLLSALDKIFINQSSTIDCTTTWFKKEFWKLNIVASEKCMAQLIASSH